MLQGLGLSNAEANAVIARGVDRGLYEADPTAPTMLRAVLRASRPGTT